MSLPNSLSKGPVDYLRLKFVQSFCTCWSASNPLPPRVESLEGFQKKSTKSRVTT